MEYAVSAVLPPVAAEVNRMIYAIGIEDRDSNKAPPCEKHMRVILIMSFTQ